MATPAEQALERERIRQSGALSREQLKASTFDLDTAIKAALVFSAQQGGDAGEYLATALKEKSRLEGLRSKLSADAFTKALGDIVTLSQKIAEKNGSQTDYLKFIAAMKTLQLNATTKLTAKDEAAISRWRQAASVVAPVGTSEHNREMVKQAIAEYKDYGEYDPMLPGTVNVINSIVSTIPADLREDWAIVEQKASDRTDQLTDLGQFAASFPVIAQGLDAKGQAEAVNQFLATLPAGKLNEFAVTASKLPSSASLDAAIKAKDVDAQAAKDAFEKYLKMDPMAVIAAIKGDAAGTKAKDSERLRILSSEKFQRWAASNGLRVGSVRPATSEEDKKLPGYIASTNSVYVAGPEDDRALGIATKQATMKPSQMLIPRRGLETRKYVEATVGGTPQPGLTNFTKVAFDNKAKKAVFIRADGSAVDEDGGSYDTELASKLTSQPLTGEQLQKVNDDMAQMLTTTGGGQRIRGVETALMWSDPPDAIMAVETPEGKRVIIRKQDEKSINVLSGGKERKNGVIRSMFAKARERIARPGEEELKARDEAAMAEVDKAREAELEKQRQAEQAAKTDRMKPAEAKAVVETAMTEEPVARPEAAKPKTLGYTAEDISADVGRAKQLVGLGEKPGASIELQKLARRARGAEAYMTSDPNQYRAVMLQLGKEASDFLNKRDQVLGPGTPIPAEDTSRERALYLASQPEVQVTPTTEAGKEVREASAVNMTGGNAPQVPGTAKGTPASIPAFGEDVQKRKAEADAARAERIRQAILAERKKKQLEVEAQPMGADVRPTRPPPDTRAETPDADKDKLLRGYTQYYQRYAAQK